jgi:hypothetical protein
MGNRKPKKSEERKRSGEEKGEVVCHEEAFFCWDESVLTDRYQSRLLNILKKVVERRLWKGNIK